MWFGGDQIKQDVALGWAKKHFAHPTKKLYFYFPRPQMWFGNEAA